MLSCCQRAAAQIRIKRLCKICPFRVSVVLVTALAKGLQAFQTLAKRSAQNHPTRIVCACSSLAPLSPLPSTQPHAGPPLRGCFSRVACPASPHTRKRRPGVTLTGWRWCQGSAFPAFRKVGECQRWQSDRTVSASSVVASGSIPRPALLSGARCGRYARRAAGAARRKKPVAKVCRFWRADTLLVPVYES